MRGIVYRIEFPDGYFYIGSTTKTLTRRLQEHKRERLKTAEWVQKNGYEPTTRFGIYLAKYGWNNPTISTHTICEFDTRKELYDFETSIIKKHYSDPKCLNDICRGLGNAGCHTEQQKLCWLQRKLDRLQDEFQEFWINKILENWFSRPGVYSFAEAYKSFHLSP